MQNVECTPLLHSALHIAAVQIAADGVRLENGAERQEEALQIRNVPFQVVDWSQVPPTEHPGESGVASWRTVQADDIRVRIVDYSPGYLADHWCRKGHVLLVLEGELETALQDGRTFTLTPGVSYQVEDEAVPHRSYTRTGARLFIVD
jgi:hypothetical protein